VTQITHISRMDTLGGIERLLQAFVNVPDPEIVHSLFLTGKKIHSALRPETGSIPICYSRSVCGIHLPKFIRSAHRNRILAKFNPDVISFWGYPTTDHDQMNFPSSARLVYQEHGSCWDMEITDRKKAFLNRMDGITCCSHAAKRVLEIRWGCTNRITVVRNPVSPHAMPSSMRPKTLSKNRPVILGTAGRLVPYKATVLALFTLKHLLESGADCRLHIAGTGPLLQSLKAKAAQLGVESQVVFAGTVMNMPTFYEKIDIFLLPSIREPLGLVGVEAMAAGCPVIATSADGIPEAVINGETGFCIQPELTINEYEQLVGAEFGGKFPESVYDPTSDRLRPPLAPDPNALATAVQKLIGNPILYETMSRTAIDTALTNFSFDTYYAALKSALLKPS
jgi:glycosyltransferase involved in cell wall biosynthesis